MQAQKMISPQEKDSCWDLAHEVARQQWETKPQQWPDMPETHRTTVPKVSCTHTEEKHLQQMALGSQQQALRDSGVTCSWTHGMAQGTGESACCSSAC